MDRPLPSAARCGAGAAVGDVRRGTAPAAASVEQPRQTSSLDETQIDVRGYHGGRPDEVAAAGPIAAEPAAAESSSPAADGPDLTIDYGTAGERATCGSCGATIRSSHRYCPACGVKQASAG